MTIIILPRNGTKERSLSSHEILAHTDTNSQHQTQETKQDVQEENLSYTVKRLEPGTTTDHLPLFGRSGRVDWGPPSLTST